MAAEVSCVHVRVMSLWAQQVYISGNMTANDHQVPYCIRLRCAPSPSGYPIAEVVFKTDPAVAWDIIRERVAKSMRDHVLTENEREALKITGHPKDESCLMYSSDPNVGVLNYESFYRIAKEENGNVDLHVILGTCASMTTFHHCLPVRFYLMTAFRSTYVRLKTEEEAGNMIINFDVEMKGLDNIVNTDAYLNQIVMTWCWDEIQQLSKKYELSGKILPNFAIGGIEMEK